MNYVKTFLDLLPEIQNVACDQLIEHCALRSVTCIKELQFKCAHHWSLQSFYYHSVQGVHQQSVFMLNLKTIASNDSYLKRVFL
jgi:hypothetical protein